MDETINHATRLMELWGEMASRMAMAGMQCNPQSAPPEAARRVRATVFQAMAQFADQYMRSPEFLSALKQGFDSNLKLREQYNELLTRLHHEFRGVAQKDVESLLRGVHQAECRIVEYLDDLSARLDLIVERLDSRGEGAAPAEGAKPSAGKKRRAQP